MHVAQMRLRKRKSISGFEQSRTSTEVFIEKNELTHGSASIKRLSNPDIVVVQYYVTRWTRIIQPFRSVLGSAKPPRRRHDGTFCIAWNKHLTLDGSCRHLGRERQQWIAPRKRRVLHCTNRDSTYVPTCCTYSWYLSIGPGTGGLCKNL